ncbi:ABC transporter permease [Stygiobacter electus]|uniref:ABC transporter permease n=1 Tax=Stygiobacter electus TaxID=3032292 RepID=A0AAE3P2B4_9BACT|nr:ABC transporter permease [Stygiobacter electus]MDF1612789.1 ABC transporter permease [Stygiobacter electus]
MIKNFRKNNIDLLFIFLSGVVLLFIASPIIGLYFNSTLNGLIETTTDVEVQESIWLTLWTSMLGTIVFSFFAIPLAYLLARKNFPLKNFVNGIIDLPIIIPHTAAGIALLGILNRNTFIGKIAETFGLSFIGNSTGIILAMSFVSIPFLINSARDGFLSVPERLEKVALTLGASKTKVFFSISLPLAWRSVLSGLILMWARGMSEFGAVIIIAYNPKVTPILIYERFTTYGLKYAVPVTVIFISISLMIFIFLKVIKKKN